VQKIDTVLAISKYVEQLDRDIKRRDYRMKGLASSITQTSGCFFCQSFRFSVNLSIAAILVSKYAKQIKFMLDDH
jgi:hypothetical protein